MATKKEIAEAKAAAAKAKKAATLSPTVTIGGAPAGYKPATSMQPTATFGGAPAAYKPTVTPNFITGAGISAAPTSIPYGTPVPGFTPAFPMPAPAAEPGESGFVGPVATKPENKSQAKKEIDKQTRDAYALLEEAFKLYGLDSLVPVIRGYMEEDLGVEQAKLRLKTEKAYKERFKGNELRVAKGLNVLGEAEYLELENDYSETLRSYGLSDYFGVAADATSRLARQQKMADVIGNDISAAEFKDRISTVVTRVNLADTNTKTALKTLYNITDTDLVKYFLNPAEGSAQLKQKVTAAEISGASMTQGLGQTSLGTAEELARLGIDKAEALAGYSKIAGYLPTSEKLSAIYKVEGINYDKATAEEEEFKGLASAKRKRQRLIERETAAFSGSSGTSQVSLKTNTRGQI